MLVLARRPGESVVIHDDLYCTVVGFENGEVRLAFDAPKTIPINRFEIENKIREHKKNINWISTKPTSQECVVDRLIRKFKRKRRRTR